MTHALQNSTRTPDSSMPMRGMQSLLLATGQGIGSDGRPIQRASRRAKKSGYWWPGKGLGIRPPECDETPLSWSEVRFAPGLKRKMLG